MRLAGKTACLLFLLILISPPFMNLFPEEESFFDDDIFFFEEFFIFEEMFSFDESMLDAETFLTEENLYTENLYDEEFYPYDESFFASDDLDDIFDDNSDYSLDENDFFFQAPTLVIEAPKFEIRSLDVVFPNLSIIQRILISSNEGFRNYFLKDESPMLIPNPDLEIDLLSTVMETNPSHLIEAMVLVPYNERELDLLDIYNALGRIEKIKDHPATIDGNDFYIFTESSRIESSRDRRAISDPPPAETLPFSETFYLRLRENSFGNLFFRGDISISMYGITYSMINFTDVRFFLLPIMRAERFITIIYLETVKEGLLIYSMSGFYLPNFIADRVNLNPNINRRIEVFLKWITEGLWLSQ